jgi:hypothetical protein
MGMRSTTYLLMLGLVTAWTSGARSADFCSVVAVLKHDEALARAHDVELLGDYALVAGKGGSIAVVDVANPEEPKLVWFRHDRKGLPDAETILTAEDRFFLGTLDFHSVDFSNPQKPLFQRSLSDRPRISRINGMVRRGDFIFAANKDGWLDLFDVSDPEEPRLAGALETRKRYEIGWPHDVDLYGPYLVVPDPQRFGRDNLDGKLAVFRVADDDGNALSVDQWKLTGVVASQELTGANRVQMVGRVAMVGGSQSGVPSRFVTVDLAEPNQPRQLASLVFSDPEGPNGLTAMGNTVFLAGGQTIEAIDVTDPAKPVKIGAQTIPEALPTGRDNGHDLVVRDGYIYLTGQNDNCLVVLQLTNAPK